MPFNALGISVISTSKVNVEILFSNIESGSLLEPAIQLTYNPDVTHLRIRAASHQRPFQ